MYEKTLERLINKGLVANAERIDIRKLILEIVSHPRLKPILSQVL